MFECIFSGTPRYDIDHDAYVFLGRDFKRRIHFCAVCRTAIIKMAQGLIGNVKAGFPNVSQYQRCDLERLLIDHPEAIEKASAWKVARADFTPNGAIFIQEADVSVN